MKTAIVLAAAFGVGIFTGAIVTAKSLEAASASASQEIAIVNTAIPVLPPLLLPHSTPPGFEVRRRQHRLVRSMRYLSQEQRANFRISATRSRCMRDVTTVLDAKASCGSLGHLRAQVR